MLFASQFFTKYSFMKKLFLLIGTIILLADAAVAQNENNVWAFGDSLGLDFNSGNPVLIPTAIRTLGGSANVCDASGQLLFYTQGDTVWNRNNQVMPNGFGLSAPYFSNANGLQASQGQLIIPVLSNHNQYYIFSIESTTDFLNGDGNAARLYYSVVDMTLDGGLGDVVTGQKNIKLDSMLTGEKMIAIPGAHCDMWLMVHNVGDNAFKAYNINDTGIAATPVISTVGNMPDPMSYALGKMRVSPDYTRIVTANWLFGLYGCELYDFDQATGVVSNPIVIDSLAEIISACFSPNGRKLYTLHFAGGNGALDQFDLNQPNTAAIVASKTLIDTLYDAGTAVFDAKLAPDGKIYVRMPYSPVGPQHDTIGCVNDPDLAGLACNYVHAALVSAQPVTLGNGDLPNEFVRPGQDTTYTNTNTDLNMSGNLTLHAPMGFYTYQWNTGDTTDSLNVTETGVYWVTYTSFCSRVTDTFHVDSVLDVNRIERLTALNAYPNPANDKVTVVIRGYNDIHGTIRVLDVMGRTLLTRDVQNNRTEINVGSLPNGVYNVTYSDNKYTQLRKNTSLVISR